MKERHDREDADAVGDECRSILTKHGRFAEETVAVFHQEINDDRIGVRSRNDLQQAQVAGRVKEVRSAEVFSEILATPLSHQVDGNAGGVGGNQCTGFPVALHLFEERAFDIDILDNSLQHPVAGRDILEMIGKVACPDAPSERLAVERCRIRLECVLETGVHDAIPNGGILQ